MKKIFTNFIKLTAVFAVILFVGYTAQTVFAFTDYNSDDLSDAGVDTVLGIRTSNVPYLGYDDNGEVKVFEHSGQHWSQVGATGIDSTYFAIAVDSTNIPYLSCI